ncbi:MAG: hypothetical protein NVS4B8_07960 [Herpetosiphon sp.]
MAKTVVGLFNQPRDAQAALRDVQSAGIRAQNVQLIEKATSGMHKSLVQAGVPEHDAQQYDAGVRNGGGLIIAQALPDKEAMQVVEILDRHHVVDIDRAGEAARQTPQATSTSHSSTVGTGTTSAAQPKKGSTQHYEGKEMVVPIIEEQVQVGKREVETGGVRVETHVTEKPVTAEVTLREEQVHVERRPVNRAVEAGQLEQVKEGTFEVREKGEQAVVSKQARVVEEVVINKEAHERTETIKDTVTRTDVDVQNISDEQHHVHDGSQKRKQN